MTDVWEIKPSDPFTTTITFGTLTLYGYLTNYEYDASNNLKKVTQGSQPARVFNYDSLNRLKNAANPESGTTVYDYDENGNLKTKTDARGVITTFEYDDLKRLQSKTHSDGTPAVTYSYDTATLGVGRLASVTSSATTLSIPSDDSSGRVKTSTQLTDGISYTMSYDYNRAGNLIRQTYPSGRIVDTENDNAGRIAGIKNGSGVYYAGAAPGDADAIQYAAHGAIRTMKFGNTFWEHSAFNSRLQTTEIGLGTSSSDSSKLKLSYDYGLLVAGTPDPSKNNGNLQRQTITAPGMVLVQSYTYDELDRLLSATEKNGTTPTWAQVFKYDQFGNRRFDSGTTLPAIPPGSENTINPEISGTNNRISGAGYRYDSAGNLECDPLHPCGASPPFPAYYTYDADNRLTTAGGGAGSGGATYIYDGEGKRVKKLAGTVTTVFVYSISGQLLAEYSDSTPPPPGGTSYITADNLGSPRAIMTSDGAIGRRDFQPFGEAIPATVGRSGIAGYPATENLRQQFTEKERDVETGLDYFINRYYSSTQGRFTSVDPTLKSIDPANPQTLNRYSYALNNPLVFIDPDGLDPLFIGSWDKLTLQQKRLFETYVQQNYAEELKNPLFSAERLWNDSVAVANGDAAAGPNSRLLDDGQLTNFVGVTNMLEKRGVIDQVASISEIHGDAPEGQTYRIIGELKNNSSAVDAIKKAFPWPIMGKGHGQYSDSNREQGPIGAPNGQVSRVPKGTGVDIDVDYRCIFCKGHVSKGGLGSDIRVGTHYEDGRKRYGPMPALSRTNDKELRPKSLY